MSLTADQELRRQLLLFCLGRLPDLDAAIALAARMERVIRLGFEPSRDHQQELAGEDQGASQHLAGRSQGEEAEAPRDKSALETNGHNASISGSLAGGTKRRWSAADDALLKRLWHSQQSLFEIAEELDRTTPSLYCRARALGLSKRSVKPKRSGNSTTTSSSKSRNQGESARRREIKLDRYVVQTDNRNGHGRPRNASHRENESTRTRPLATHAIGRGRPETSIDPIINFLRSRDYSVIRDEDGRFRLDGRRTLSANELREKANQVRKMLGQPPFA